MTAIRSAVAAIALIVTAGSAQALTIDVLFDSTPGDDTVTAPFLGSATLTLDGFFPDDIVIIDDGDLFDLPGLQLRGEDPLADGFYRLDQFEVFEFTASFFNGGVVFTEADLDLSTSDVGVQIRTTPDGRAFGFDPLIDDEILISAVSFTDDSVLGTERLTFQPGYGSQYVYAEFGGIDLFSDVDTPIARNLLIQPQPNFEIFGTFGPETPTSDVPVPAALPLMALGLAALSAAARRRKA